MLVEVLGKLAELVDDSSVVDFQKLTEIESTSLWL